MKRELNEKPLGDLCQFIGGGTPAKNMNEYYNGNIPWATVRDMRSDIILETEFKITEEAVKRSATHVIPSGNVVIATRVGLGKVCLLGQDTAINQDLRGIIPNNPKTLSNQFLFLWLKSIAHTIVAEGTGATVQGVKLPFVKSIRIPIFSLPEQQRIVAVLDQSFDAIDTAKANTEKNLQNAHELFEELIQSLFPDVSEVRTDARPLSDLCEMIVDCEHKTAPIQEHGIPSIRTPNVGKGRLLLDGVNLVSEETYKAWTRREKPQAGDLIFAREAPAGNVAVIPEGMKVCLGQRTVLIRPKKDIFHSDYLAHFLLRRNSQRRLLDYSRGATVQHVNMKDIRAFKISGIPSIEDQQRIVDRLNEILIYESKLLVCYQKKLSDLDELKKSYMQKAFNGELTEG